MRLDPSSEKLPDGGVRKREAQKAHTNHQNAAQRCGAMQFVRRPQIIECQQKQEAVGGKQGWENPLVEEEDVKAGERGHRPGVRLTLAAMGCGFRHLQKIRGFARHGS